MSKDCRQWCPGAPIYEQDIIRVVHYDYDIHYDYVLWYIMIIMYIMIMREVVYYSILYK
jgi:hypothetical protein